MSFSLDHREGQSWDVGNWYLLICGNRLNAVVAVMHFCATAGAFHKVFRFLLIGQPFGILYLLLYQLDGARHTLLQSCTSDNAEEEGFLTDKLPLQ